MSPSPRISQTGCPEALTRKPLRIQPTPSCGACPDHAMSRDTWLRTAAPGSRNTKLIQRRMAAWRECYYLILKVETLYLQSQGLSAEQIQRLCVISKATYYRYLNEYRAGRLAHLKEVSVVPHTSEFKEYHGTLEAYFLAHPPAMVAEASATITALTGIARGPTQVRQFLHTLGMKPRKVGTMPAKADVEAQEECKKRLGPGVARYLLTLKDRPPCRLAGLETYGRLQNIDAIETVLHAWGIIPTYLIVFIPDTTKE